MSTDDGVVTVVQFRTSDDRMFNSKKTAEDHERVYQILRAINLDMYDRISASTVVERLLAKHDLTPKRGPR